MKEDQSSWFLFSWKPKWEGPYLVKWLQPAPKRPGEFITRYSIKRYVVHVPPFDFKSTQKRKWNHGSYGYFSMGGFPQGGNTMIPIGWMPIPGHDYGAIKKNDEVKNYLTENKAS